MDFVFIQFSGTFPLSPPASSCPDNPCIFQWRLCFHTILPSHGTAEMCHFWISLHPCEMGVGLGWGMPCAEMWGGYFGNRRGSCTGPLKRCDSCSWRPMSLLHFHLLLFVPRTRETWWSELQGEQVQLILAEGWQKWRIFWKMEVLEEKRHIL